MTSDLIQDLKETFKNDPVFQFWRLSTDIEYTERENDLRKMIKSICYNLI